MPRRRLRWLRDRKRVASALVVALVVGTVVALSINYRGVATADVELNDGGVWVSNESSVLVGRLNFPVREIDATFAGDTPDLDLLQRAEEVYMVDGTTSTLRRVDTANVRYTGSAVAIPGGAEVGIGENAIAVLDPADGRLWVTRPAGVGIIEDDTVEPTATLGEGTAMAVADDGTVVVVDAVDNEILRYTPDVWSAIAAENADAGEDASEEESGDDGGDSSEDGAEEESSVDPETLQPEVTVFDEGTDLTTSELQITVVGDRVVVLAYEPEAGTLTMLQPEQEPVDLTATSSDPASARLQASSVGGSGAAITTSDALVVAPLDGGDPRVVPADVGGTPVQPVQVGSCIHSAWAGGAPTYTKLCNDGEPDPQPVPEARAEADLVFRVNRSNVVLNDLVTGAVWMIEDRLFLVDEWEEQLPESAEDTETDEPSEEETDEVPLDREQENRDPTANPDDFGVRPGRTIVLPVLDNDSDPDGDLLTVATFAQVAEGFGVVESILGGRALQIRVDPGASGSTQLDYGITDGRGGEDASTVTLTARAPTQNAAPEQTGEITPEVVSGETIEVNVLDDVRDPDGDEIVLTGHSSDDTVTVTVRPDGLVTIRDLGVTTGLKQVTVQVSDGRGESVPVVVDLQVLPLGPAPPQAVFDFGTGFVDEPILVEPLANDIDPNGKPLDLNTVVPSNGGRVETDTAAGTFTFEAPSAGAYYLTYVVSDDDGLSATGLVRVDVKAAIGDATPVAVRDTALLPSNGSVAVDVLVNDSDPAGGVLAVQSIDVPRGYGLRVAILDHRILRITADRVLNEPITLGYTVSNGSRSAEGEVVVMPLDGQADVLRPVANDDVATVRAGDHVSVPVLLNDTHPNGLELEVSGLEYDDAEGGLAFISTELVRFAAPDRPGTYELSYEITDSNGQRDSATITIYVQATSDATNAPPRPNDVEVRAFSGEQIRIPIDLYGIDPDGDSVQLIGPTTSPTLGRISGQGYGYLDYVAFNNDSGTDSFSVMVRDRFGATGEATVTVGVIPPPDLNRSPVTAPDYIEVRPGRNIQTDVLSNDTDPDGDQLQFAETAVVDAPEDWEVGTDEGLLTFASPTEEGTYTIQYQVDDTHGGRDIGALTVVVDRDAPTIRPVGVDDVVPATDLIDAETLQVEVLVNDYDPDGSTDDLVVSLPPGQEGVTVLEDGRLSIPVPTQRQVITYQLTDPDDEVTYAFVEVPGTEDTGPVLLPGTRLEVNSGEELVVDLQEWVVSLTGDPIQLYDLDGVTAANSDGGPYVVDETTLRFVSAPDFAGEASITFSVTDAPDVNADGILVSVLTIPIDVIATSDQPPVLRNGSLDLEAGGDSQTLNLGRLAADADTANSDLDFELGDVPGGFSASLENDVVLTASAALDTQPGTSVALPYIVSDGVNDPVEGTITLTATSSQAPLLVANDDAIGEINQGDSQTVPVLANDTNPFDGGDRRIVDAFVQTGSGGVDISGDSVVVTPAGDYVGQFVVVYTVADDTEDPERWAQARVTAVVLGSPEVPARPAVGEEGNRQVTIDISPPQDNGSPITSYEVTASGGPTTTCETTTCVIGGLQNGTTYTFTVVAVNAVGPSEPSPPSAEATPDVRPGPVAAPSVEYGDGELSLAWTQPVNEGTDINEYDIQISPAPGSGSQVSVDGGTLSYTWEGLTNGTTYEFRVRAHNEHPDPGDWGAWSRGEYPSGPPMQPAAPSMERIDTPAGGQVQATWTAPNDNGDSIDAYYVTLYRNGSEQTTVQVDGGTLTHLFRVENGFDYSVSVVAENRSGRSDASPQSSAVRSFGQPGQVTGVSGAPTGQSGQVQITYGTPSDNGQAIDRFEYRLSPGGSGNLGASPAPISGLTNGQSYTIQVRACNTYCGDWSASSAAFSPYGPPATPPSSGNISSSRGNGEDGRTVSFSWSYPGNSNGAAITAAQIQVDGGGSQNRDRTGTVSVTGGWEENHSFRMRVQNQHGQWSDWSAVTRQQAGSDPTPPIPPSITFVRDRDAQGQSGCGHSSCRFLDFSYQNLPSANYTITFYASNEPGDGFWRSYSDSLSGNGTYRSTTYRGQPGEVVRVVIRGGGNTYEDEVTW